jgi:tetratricopeptide (TPR) repeat protein
MSSSVEEWASKGRELFDRKKYLQAKHCYERATMPREASIAQAYFIREQARKTLSGDTRHLKERRRVAFVLAAEDFLTCAKQAKKFTPAYYRIAGECFEEAADNLRAAEAFLEAREYNIAAKLYRKLGRFDEAVAVIKENEEWMHGDVVENIKDVARLHYFSKEKLKYVPSLFFTCQS